MRASGIHHTFQHASISVVMEYTQLLWAGQESGLLLTCKGLVSYTQYVQQFYLTLNKKEHF